jgi:hypothetical protein
MAKKSIKVENTKNILPTLLFNDKSKPLVGTTGLLPQY